ncbi:MAG: hypothetical protein ACLT0A_04140 [Holdemanella porci]|uniref:hypothetical protein n=1 Tax=Holdemanella porci TaxID=2652276 RepID=UPI0039966723
MINAEKFRKELLELSNQNIAFAVRKENQNAVVRCDSIKRCTDCLFGRGRCSVNSTKWLLSEYKEPVKLSKLEYDILKYLLNDTGYRYIARNKYRHEGGVYNLYIFKDEPFEDSGVWCSGRDSGNEFYVFNNLFAFVKWEDSKPTSIEDVLKNCEVVNDAEE